MNIAAHQHKISKLGELRHRFDPLVDFELWFWSAMLAGTHAVNAALHHAGVTRADDVFPTQPGVYLVPRPDGSLVSAFHPLGDVLHVGRPHIDAPLPADVQQMMHAMEQLEGYRDPCERVGQKPSEEIVQTCERALGECLDLLHKRIGG